MTRFLDKIALLTDTILVMKQHNYWNKWRYHIVVYRYEGKTLARAFCRYKGYKRTAELPGFSWDTICRMKQPEYQVRQPYSEAMIWDHDTSWSTSFTISDNSYWDFSLWCAGDSISWTTDFTGSISRLQNSISDYAIRKAYEVPEQKGLKVYGQPIPRRTPLLDEAGKLNIRRPEYVRDRDIYADFRRFLDTLTLKPDTLLVLERDSLL